MDLDRIEALLTLLERQQHVGTLSVQGDGWTVRARRGPYHPLPPAEEAPDEVAESEAAEQCIVRAEVVGIYRGPKALPTLGEFVPAGAVLGSIDSMRVLNPVTVEHEGYLAAAHVEDGDPVEYGQQLFVLSAAVPETHDAR
jgi:biotin carboxyl carrier protein